MRERGGRKCDRERNGDKGREREREWKVCERKKGDRKIEGERCVYDRESE